MKRQFNIRDVLLLTLLIAVAIAGYQAIQKAALERKLRTSISELNLSLRASACLEYGRVETVCDLVQMSEEEVFQIRNVGDTTLVEIRQKLSDLKLHFNMGL